ncbi:TPA: hypothetical protein ACH3X2_001966 [Trebouxia sp. C0005]
MSYLGRSLAVSESPAAAAPSVTFVFGSSFEALAPGPASDAIPLPRLPTDISPAPPSQNTSLSLAFALSANSTALAQSTTTVNIEYCALPACGVNCIEFSLSNPSGDSCYIPGLGGITQISVFDNDTCCPTSPSTYAFDGEACGCGTTPQLCPALPPSPQESPSPLDSSPELLLSIPPPPSPPPVVMTASTAAKVPVVTATQKLADFTVATFDTTAKDSFLTTLSNNIEKLSGPIQVSIPNGGITPGSVNVQTSVVFLNGDADSVEAYKSAMRSSSSSVFGTFAAVVDPNTISESNTTNPQSGRAHNQIQSIYLMLMIIVQ